MILQVLRYVDISFSSVLSKVSGLATCHVGAAVGKGPQLQTDLIEDLFLRNMTWKTKLNWQISMRPIFGKPLARGPRWIWMSSALKSRVREVITDM